MGLTISAKHMATLTGPACRATLMQVHLNSILFILFLIYYYTTMLCHHKASLSLFFICPSNNVVTRQTFIVFIWYITIQQCSDTTKLHCPHSFSCHPTMLWYHKPSFYSFYLLPYNNAVAPQSFIVFISTMRCHHKAPLSSSFFFPSDNVAIRQTFIVLISYITIQQCCGTTELHCPHSFNPIQQSCDTTKFHCTLRLIY